jgi:hypothetical protein
VSGTQTSAPFGVVGARRRPVCVTRRLFIVEEPPGRETEAVSRILPFLSQQRESVQTAPASVPGDGEAARREGAGGIQERRVSRRDSGAEIASP